MLEEQTPKGTPMPEDVRRKSAEVADTNSSIIDAVVTDGETNGRFFAIYGAKTPQGADQRFIILTHSKAEDPTSKGTTLLTIFSREGAVALNVPQSLKPSVDSVIRYQIEHFQDYPNNPSPEITKGGLVTNPNGRLVFAFGNPDNDGTIKLSHDNQVAIDQQTFLEGIRASRSAVENPNVKRLAAETQRLTEAQQLLAGFQQLAATPPAFSV